MVYSVLYFMLISFGITLREDQIFEEKNDPQIMRVLENLIDLKIKLNELIELKRDVTEGMAVFPFLWVTQAFFELVLTLCYFRNDTFFSIPFFIENGILWGYYIFFIHYIGKISSRKKRFGELLNLNLAKIRFQII